MPDQKDGSGESVPRRVHGRIFFEDWSVSDPECEKLGEALHTARYDIFNVENTRLLKAIVEFEEKGPWAVTRMSSFGETGNCWLRPVPCGTLRAPWL